MAEPRTLITHPELRSHRSFPLFRTLGERPKGPIEKALSVFADVRAGEGAGVLLLMINVFLLLGAYYLLKTVREALILSEGGAEVKTYASAGQAMLLLGLIPLYGWVGTKLNRVKLVSGLMLFFILNLVLFYAGGKAGLKEGVVFYIWLGIFNVFAVSQVWAFANDIYTEGQGRRLFPMVGVGSSLGAWLGANLAGKLVKSAGLTPYTLMALAACILLACAGLIVAVNRTVLRQAEPEAAKEAETPLEPAGAWTLIRQDRYLFWIAILTVLLNVVNTSGEYLLSRLVVQEAVATIGAGEALAGERARFIGGFYGSFFGWVNLLGLLIQLFAVSRLMRHAGVRGSLFVLPCLALVSYSVLAVAPVLAVVRITKVLENSTDYSLQNTVRQALYLPASREAKYKAKAAIDTFFMRFGDVASAGIVYLGNALAAGIQTFAALNVLLTVAWLWVAGRIAAEHRRRTV